MADLTQETRALIDQPRSPMATIAVWVVGPLLLSVFVPQLRISLANGNLLPLAVVAGLWLAPMALLAEISLRGRVFIVGGGAFVYATALFANGVLSDLVNGKLGATYSLQIKAAILIVWSAGLFLILDRKLATRLAQCYVWVVLGLSLFEIADVLSSGGAVNIFQADLRTRNASAHSTLVAVGLLAPSMVIPRFSLLGAKRLDRIAIAVLLAAVALSLSRGGVIAAVLGIVILLTMSRNVQRAIVAGMGLAALAVVLVIVSPTVIDRIETSLITDTDVSIEARVSNGTRLVAARIGLEIWLDNPVFGAGTGSYPELFRNYLRGDDPHVASEVQSPHNQYLHFLAESGPIPALLFAAWVASSCRRTFRLLRAGPAVDPLYLSLAFGWLPHAIYFFFSFPYERVSFWLFVALSSWALGRAELDRHPTLDLRNTERSEDSRDGIFVGT